MFSGKSLGLLAIVSLLASGCAFPPTAPSGEANETQAPATTASERSVIREPRTGAELSAAELQGRWWTWAASSVPGSSPVADPDGHLCAKGQVYDIWFLAGSFGEEVTRSCTIPAALPVAFPLTNLIGSAQDCAAFMETAQGSAVLNGRPLKPQRYEATAVSVSAVAGNPITEGGGRFRTHACGLWVRLEPLDPGSHELSIRGSSGGFEVSVDYTLQVRGT